MDSNLGPDLGHAAFALGDHAAAEAYIRTALQTGQVDADVHHHLGYLVRHRNDRRRSMPLELFTTLLTDHPDREFHVVPTELRPSDLPVLASLPHVHDHAVRLHDFGDTSALLSLMDLVITVDTSVAHLAGSLGSPTWPLLPHLADWRCLLEQDDSPWFPSMESFRQPERGDWATVLAMVAARLREMLA